AGGSFVNTVGVTTTGNGNVLLNSGPLTISQAINAGSGIVRLVSSGSVNEDVATGTITAGSLGVRAGANVTLNQGNNVNFFAAANSGSGNKIEYKDAAQVAVGPVAAGGSFLNTIGITTTGNGDVLLNAGPLTISQPIAAGNGVLRLVSSGAI